jgi:hypothetical protein
MRTAILFAAAIGVCLLAQDAPRLRGRVVDENNTPVAGAEISVRYQSRDLTTFSDPTGAYALTLPAPGDYDVRVSKPGYFELRGRAIHVSEGPNETNLVLNRLREASESVNVSGIPPPINMDAATPEQRLNSTELLEIPYRDNNSLQNAMRTLPGVIQDTQGNIHLDGGAANQVYYMLDGFNINDVLSGGFGSRLSIEAVQSLNVQTGSLPAEFGKGTAGAVNVTTKMGDDLFRYSATNFIPGIEYRKGLILGSWTPRFNFSGPLKKGKVWFSDSLTGQYANDVVRDLPPGQDRSYNWRYSNLFRVQVNLTPSNILYAGFLVNQSAAVRNGLSALDPPPTTTDLRAHQYFFDIKDQLYFGHGSLLEYGFASNRTYGREIPQGHDFYIFTPYGRAGNYFVDGRQRGGRDQFLANYFLRSFTWLGEHQIKTGIDLDRLSYWQDMQRTGFINYNVQDLPVRKVTFAGNGMVGQSNFETSSYVEDSWRTRPHLLLELGLRLDWDQILHNWNVGPRIGFAWAPFGLERTKVSGGYGLLYDDTNLSLFARTADQNPISTFYIGGAPFYSIASFLIGKQRLETPRSNNFNLGVEQGFADGYFLSVRGILRRASHGLSFFDTTGALAPDIVYSLLDQRRDSYGAVEFTLRHNMRKQYEWLVSYTRSRAASNAVLDLSADQPLIVASNYGRLPWDAPNRFLSWAFLPTPFKKWSFMYLLEWHSGFPFYINNDLGQVIGGPSANRFPDFLELDLHVEREFAFRNQRWAWRMGVNNVLGRLNPNTVNNDISSPQFGQFFGGQRQTLGFRVRWLGKT